MDRLRIRTAAEQLADYLKEGISAGRWTGQMPGEGWIMTHLQVGRDTVRAAMGLLEQEGVLVSDGQGKRRRIVLSPGSSASRMLRVRILTYEARDRGDIYCSTLVTELLKVGMDADFANKPLTELGMNVDRVARFVNGTPADAWVVFAASQEVLGWFAEQEVPAIAMFGIHKDLTIAAAYTMMMPGQHAAVGRLIELGHKRIVMLSREERRKPHISRSEQEFLDQLESAGIKTGAYNLPDWKESREGLSRLLDELFRHSPPTALFFQEAQLFIAARSHLADRGVVAPRDVSLVVSHTDPCFSWCNPEPSHIRWDYRPVVRRVVRWAKNVAQGKEDRKKFGTETEFIEGGTIGPVPGRGGG